MRLAGSSADRWWKHGSRTSPTHGRQNSLECRATSARGSFGILALCVACVCGLVLLAKWSGSSAQPRAAIPDVVESSEAANLTPRVTHQPTVLQVDSEASPRFEGPRHPASPVDRSDVFVGDRELAPVPAPVPPLLTVPERVRP